jgi:hypothetical protein
VAPDGEAVVAWGAPSDVEPDRVLASFRRGGVWSAPVVLSNSSQVGLLLGVAAAPDGGLAVAIEESAPITGSAVPPGHYRVIYAAPGEPPGPSATAATIHPDVAETALAFAGAGRPALLIDRARAHGGYAAEVLLGRAA